MAAAVGFVLLALALSPSLAEARKAPDPIVAAVNEARADHGLHDLRHSRALSRSSARFARYQAARGSFGHGARIPAIGGFRALGEAIALGAGWHPRPRRVVRRWLRSSAHRWLILSTTFDHVGGGRARGRFNGRRATVWVLRLGSR